MAKDDRWLISYEVTSHAFIAEINRFIANLNTLKNGNIKSKLKRAGNLKNRATVLNSRKNISLNKGKVIIGRSSTINKLNVKNTSLGIPRNRFLDSGTIGKKDIGIVVDRQIDAAESIKDAMKVHPNSRFGKAFREYSKSNIFGNLQKRFTRSFPRGSSRIQSAMSDKRFMEVNYDKAFFFGLANADILDRETSLFIDREGNYYEPPTKDGTYGKIIAFWQLHEFTGAGRKRNFRSAATERYVRSKGWMPGFKRRNFILNDDFDLFDEDKNAILNISNIITENVIKAFKQFGGNSRLRV